MSENHQDRVVIRIRREHYDLIKSRKRETGLPMFRTIDEVIEAGFKRKAWATKNGESVPDVEQPTEAVV